MHAQPQFRVYVMHDLGALRRARPTAIAVPLVVILVNSPHYKLALNKNSTILRMQYIVFTSERRTAVNKYVA